MNKTIEVRYINMNDLGVGDILYCAKARYPESYTVGNLYTVVSIDGDDTDEDELLPIVLTDNYGSQHPWDDDLANTEWHTYFYKVFQ